MELVKLDDSMFRFKDQHLHDQDFRVFDYHFASQTNFSRPSARECRGVMFLMEGNVPVELVSLPQRKFFNLHEISSKPNDVAQIMINLGLLTEQVYRDLVNGKKNISIPDEPLQYDESIIKYGIDVVYADYECLRPIDYTKIVRFEEKGDGSLITTYWCNDEVQLKSKVGLTSIMANDSNDYIRQPEHENLLLALRFFASRGYTVIMEWCDPKPESRIVLKYDNPHLKVFSIRNNSNGELIDFNNHDTMLNEFSTSQVIDHVKTLEVYQVARYYPDDPEAFIEAVMDTTDIEGYIMVMDNDLRWKIKTPWYLRQHKLKDSVTNILALFECVITGTSDDLRSAFYDNAGAIELIDVMEEYAFSRYSHFVNTVEQFAIDNKNLSRKEYAIKATAELEGYMMHPAMQRYQNCDVDYVSQMIGKPKFVKLHTKDFSYNPFTKAEE